MHNAQTSHNATTLRREEERRTKNDGTKSRFHIPGHSPKSSHQYDNRNRSIYRDRISPNPNILDTKHRTSLPLLRPRTPTSLTYHPQLRISPLNPHKPGQHPSLAHGQKLESEAQQQRVPRSEARYVRTHDDGHSNGTLERTRA